MKTILSVLGAIIIAELVPGLWWAIRGIGNSKATAIDALPYLLLESLFSPLFWILAVALFAVFFWSSRAGHLALRVIFFWIPTLTACLVGGVIASLLAYLTVHFRHS